MTSDPMRRVRYGAGLLAIIALFGVTRLICRDIPGASPTLDAQVQSYTERYAGLRDALPARGVVGYLSAGSEIAPRENEAPDERASYEARWFMLTQYALAPLIVVPDLTRPLIICNVANPAEVARVCRRPGLAVVRDLGNGVALLRRAQD